MLEATPSIDKALVQSIKSFPDETVYEITTAANRLPFGLAIADIRRSVPHHHNRTQEIYVGVQGDLEVTIGETQHELHPGETIQIPIGQTHTARTLEENPARIIVITIPEWSPEDHILDE